MYSASLSNIYTELNLSLPCQISFPKKLFTNSYGTVCTELGVLAASLRYQTISQMFAMIPQTFAHDTAKFCEPYRKVLRIPQTFANHTASKCARLWYANPVRMKHQTHVFFWGGGEIPQEKNGLLFIIADKSSTVCQRSSDSFYIVSDYIKWVERLLVHLAWLLHRYRKILIT